MSRCSTHAAGISGGYICPTRLASPTHGHRRSRPGAGRQERLVRGEQVGSNTGSAATATIRGNPETLRGLACRGLQDRPPHPRERPPGRERRDEHTADGFHTTDAPTVHTYKPGHTATNTRTGKPSNGNSLEPLGRFQLAAPTSGAPEKLRTRTHQAKRESTPRPTPQAETPPSEPPAGMTGPDPVNASPRPAQTARPVHH